MCEHEVLILRHGYWLGPMRNHTNLLLISQMDLDLNELDSTLPFPVGFRLTLIFF